MRQRVAEDVVEMARRRMTQQLQASPEWLRVSAWLRGDDEKLNSLMALLSARIEERGALDLPSTPYEAASRAVMDKEDRILMATFSYIHSLPINTSSNEADNE